MLGREFTDMRCNNCGYIVPDDSDFCQYCGARIEFQPEPVVTSSPTEGKEDYPVMTADEITQSQRFFDSDYGYSPENPIVTSSIQMVGVYLYSLRTADGQKFTWERNPRKDGSMVDEYQLFIDGAPYKTIYFNPHGRDTEHLPVGLKKDAQAVAAAQQGISLEEYQAKLKAEEEKKIILAEKKKKAQSKTRKFLTIAFIIIVLCCGGYFGAHYGIPYLKYKSAVHNMNNGNPEKAVETFVELGDYKDSKTLITECTYLQAGSLFDAQDYLSAREKYESIKHFKDSKDLIQKCNLEIGKQFLAEKNYKDAIDVLANLDSDEAVPLLAECYYNYMVECISNADWGRAYVNYNKTLEHDLNKTHDLNQHQYKVFTEYAKWKLEGTVPNENNCNDAITAITALIDTYGETSELSALKENAETRLLEAKYQSATMFFQGGTYKNAVDKYAEILEYKDSREKWLESMYLYVQANKNNSFGSFSIINSVGEWIRIKGQKETFYQYAETLSKNNYKDSKSFYSELIAWKAYTNMNNDPDDSELTVNSVSKYDDICVHVKLYGGPLDGSTKLKYVFTLPNGSVVSGIWDNKFSSGDEGTAWCYYNEPAYGTGGTCFVKIYDTATGKLIASDQIRVIG